MIWKRTKLKYGSVFTSLFLALVTGFVFTITANPQTPEVLAGYVSTAQLNSANNNGQPTEPKPDVGFTGELVDEYDYDKTEIIAEDTSKRTATSKTFVMADGTYVWQEYATPVHFLRDGEFREIDNTLNASLTNTANDFKVSFGQAQDDNLVRVSSQQNQYQTSVGLVPAFGTDRNEIASLSVFDGNRKLDAGRSNTLTESQATRAATLEYSTNYSSSLNELNIKDSQLNNRLQNAFTKQNSSVYYSDLYNDIDIQYILEGQSLKENIIVHAPLSSYDFRFELNLTNLFPHKTFEGDILLIDIVTLETVYIIPRGFMFDADGVYSYDVEYELEQTGSTWFLIVSACPEFFQTAQFPVTVDPTIYHGGNSNPNYVIGRHKDVESKTSATGSDKFEHWHEKFIWTIAVHYGYLNLGTQAIKNHINNKVIVDASFSFNYDQSPTLVPMIKSNTNFSRHDGRLYELNYTQASGKVTIDVKDYLEQFINQAVISIWDAKTGNSNFTSSVLTVCYVEFYAGEYNITQNLGDGGMGTVNMNNGGFGYAYDSVVTTDYHIPIQISHIFNESYGNSYGVGNGFKLNIQQRVVLEDGLCYYYQSASGKKYYFNNGAIRENKELGLRLYRNSSTGIIQLIDRQGNTLVFNSAGNLIEMHEYPSRYDAPLPAQNIKLTYSGNNISTVTNNFTTLTFGYSGGYLQTITDQSSRKLAQFVYTGDKLTRAEKYFTSSTLSTDAYATLLTYTGNKIASITNELGEKVAYAYTSNQVSSIITSNTKNSNIVPVTTSIEYVTYSRSTLLLCRIVMDRTTVLSQGNYRRHVSFKGNEVVSDYSYEKTANGNFIPMSAYSNKFDYTSFAETYADTRDLYCQEFDTSVVRSHPFNLDITFPTQSGTHSYAMLIWVKRVGNLQNKDLMISENATSLLGFFSRDLLNSNLFDWQFYVYEFNQRTNFSSFTIGIDGDGAAGFSIHSVRLVKLPPQLTKLKKEEFEPVRDSYGRPTAVFQYNAVDNSITSYEYEYGAASGNYPGQLLSITERTGSATLTKAQYEIQATQVSQVVYGYTAYSINNASFSFLTGTTTYGSSSASGAPKFTTSYGYDTVTNSATRGLLTSYTNENGETTTFTYNPNGNVTTTVSDLVYDNSYYDSGLLASTSLGGLSNQLSYNQHGGLASVGHNGFNTSFGYHNDGSLANVSVDNQQLVNYTYSQLQDVVNYSNNQSVLYNYSNDYLQSVVGIKNGTPSTIAEFSYNNRNELAGISHPNTGVDYGYQYTRDFSGTNMDHLLLAYQAANFNALATVHHAIGSDKYITAGYFKHPFAMQTLQMDTATYNYNKFGQLSGINKHNGTLSYAYNDGFNRLTDKTMAFNGGASFTSAYTYPASTITNGRVSTEEFKVGGTTQSAHTYTYYPNGNLQSIIGPNNTTEYFYDQNNQLIRENVNGTQHYYWYNAAGNMVSANAGGFKSFTYQTGWKDQLDTATFGGVTYNITYDTAGNPLQYRHGRTMTWSNGRQLTEIANPTGFFTNIKYDYDYAGMRTSKTVNGIETYYYWEGNKLLAEWKQGVLLWYYYDETGVSGMNYDGQDFYFRKNILGDITEIYNTSGQIVCYYIYDAWGNILVEQHTTYIPGSLAVVQANPWRYRGYYFDRETGFYNLNSRYYDPMLMRFVNADEPTMLFLTASMPSGANLYAYCLNNPVMYTDSTGMFIDQIWNWIQAGYYGLANAAMFMSSVAVALFSGSVTAAAVSAVLAPLGPIGVLAGVGVGALVAVGAFGSALNICWPGTNLGDFGNKINSWAGGHFNTGANFLWHDVAVPGWDWLKKNSDAISEGLFISMFYTWAVPPLFYVNFALFAASSTVSVLKYYGMI